MIAPPAPDNLPNSDSDSDWDDDDDFGAKKINIKIKPIAQVTPGKISASVDELRATVGTWKSLANINLVKPNSRRHHQSTAQLNNIGHSQAPMLAPTDTSTVLLPEHVDSLGFSLNNNDSNNVNDSKKHCIISNGASDNNSQMIDLVNIPSEQTGRDLENFNGLYPSNVEIQRNHQTSIGFLRHSSSAILSPEFQSAFTIVADHDDKLKLPVAFAIQECLNARMLKSTDTDDSRINLIGCLKMAVPPRIKDIDFSLMKRNLKVTLVNSKPWDKIRLNGEFVTEEGGRDCAQPFALLNSTKRLSIDMKAIQAHVKELCQKQPDSKYFVLPELLKYAIGSLEGGHELSGAPPRISPLNALSHWLCDLTITKVRVNIQPLEATLDELSLSTDDIKNLKISMHVNGGVMSYQSKPDANWNPLNSQLTWSFTNLTELIQKSTSNGVTSCLARFDLNDGPSSPSDVSLRFSIPGRTISGSQVLLDSTKDFKLAAQKYEVRTGRFRCEPPRL